MENDSEQLGLLKKLEEDVNEVIVLIGSNSQGWQKQLRKKHLTDEHRLRLRRRFLAAGVANTFGWLSRHGLGNPSNRLMDLQGTLLAMFNIGKESKIPLLSRDKISYMNVKFAFDFHGLQSCRLDQDLVKSFCRELVTENVDFAEPYFFFLLLFWPGLAATGESTTSPDTFDLLEECLGRLKDFERRHSEAQLRSGFNFQQQPRFLLYLRQADSDGGRAKVASAKKLKRFVQGSRDRDMFRCGGTLDDSKNVVMSFQVDDGGGSPSQDEEEGSFRHLTVRNTNLFHRMKPHVKRVTFNLAFTFAGPVACFVIASDADLERERMAQMDAASRK